jgi:hypothetical protein
MTSFEKAVNQKEKGLKLPDLLDNLRHFRMDQCHGNNWRFKNQEIPRIHRETLSSPFSHFVPATLSGSLRLDDTDMCFQHATTCTQHPLLLPCSDHHLDVL